MTHHKRGKARNSRAGCKMCKPWKANGVRNERPDGERFSDHVRRFASDEGVNDHRYSPPPAAGADMTRSDDLVGTKWLNPSWGDYPGDIDPARVMAVSDNWAMLRRPRAIPFTVWVPELINKWQRSA